MAFCAILSPRLVATAAEPAPDESSGFALKGLLLALGVFGIAALGITGVVRWGRRQDQITDMMSFCMRYLIDFQRVAEGREAAAALGRTRDPQALLVLVDVINDEAASDVVRKAARDALTDMGGRYRKFKKVINELKSASEQRDHSRLIDTLMRTFETGEKRYAPSAYIIGREYMRAGHYADAKDWFHIAEFRNQKISLYGDQIGGLIAECNERLFAKGDTLFKSGKYYDARERYSAASRELSEQENKKYSGFLRLACVYCKLSDYEDADQAVLQALKYGQQTDMSLSLNKLLQKVLDQKTSKSGEERRRLVAKIDAVVAEIMDKLYAAQLKLNEMGGAESASTR
jgi:tetratricopeptide (TPR) repeat protein